MQHLTPRTLWCDTVQYSVREDSEHFYILYLANYRIELATCTWVWAPLIFDTTKNLGD